MTPGAYSDLETASLDDLELLMWRVGLDRRLASTFGSVVILDREMDRDQLADLVRAAVQRVPRLRQRIATRGFGLPPRWVDVDRVDLDFHLRHVTLSPTADLREVLDRGSAFVAERFEDDRPLWQAVTYHGLRDGRSAMVLRAHHAVSDAENAVSLALQFVDGAGGSPNGGPHRGRPSPASDSSALTGLSGKAVRALGVLARSRPALPRSPGELGSRVSELREVASGLTAEALDVTRSSLRPVLRLTSRARRLEVLQVDLDAALRTARALGGTLNTLFLTACATAMSNYLAHVGAPAKSLVCSIAISTRDCDDGQANAFTIKRARLPTDGMPLRQRFRLIQASSGPGTRPNVPKPHFSAVAALARPLPAVVLQQAGRRIASSVDMVTSSFRVSEQTLTVTGVKVDSIYPVGPLPGVPLNITVLSYARRLYVGMHSDAATISEPWVLRDLLDDAFRQLMAAPRTHGTPSPITPARQGATP